MCYVGDGCVYGVGCMYVVVWIVWDGLVVGVLVVGDVGCEVVLLCYVGVVYVEVVEEVVLYFCVDV